MHIYFFHNSIYSLEQNSLEIEAYILNHLQQVHIWFHIFGNNLSFDKLNNFIFCMTKENKKDMILFYLNNILPDTQNRYYQFSIYNSSLLCIYQDSHHYMCWNQGKNYKKDRSLAYIFGKLYRKGKPHMFY